MNPEEESTFYPGLATLGFCARSKNVMNRSPKSKLCFHFQVATLQYGNTTSFDKLVSADIGKFESIFGKAALSSSVGGMFNKFIVGFDDDEV